MVQDRIISECVSTPECTLYSEVLKLDWNYSIYLPKGYDLEENRDREYPVIYFLHGAFGNHRNFVERIHMNRMLERLADGRDRMALKPGNDGSERFGNSEEGGTLKSGDEEGRASKSGVRFPDAIGVFVDGFNSFYIDGPGVAMESAVIKDLIPKIEKMYRIKKDRNSRMICGISMGGFGSARFALKYPEIFSACVCISPAVSDEPGENSLIRGLWHVFADGDDNYSQEFYARENPEAFIDSYEKKKTPVYFYITTGDADKVVPVREVRSFVKKLEKVAAVEYCEAPGMEHSWPFWRDAFYGAFASDTVLKHWAKSL